MTLEDLNAHLIIIQELEAAREALAALETATLTASRLDVKTHIPGVRDRTAALAVKIAMQREVVARYERAAEASGVPVKEFVDSISDNRLNVVFYLRFMCGFEWQTVAEIIGGKNTTNSVKALVYRYFRTQAAKTRV